MNEMGAGLAFTLLSLGLPTAGSLLIEAPRQSATAVPVTKLRKMDAGEIRRLIAGKMLDERPYPSDAGPLVFSADGTVTQHSGWGTTKGRYKIEGNKAIITRSNGSAYSMYFFKNNMGRAYYRYDGGRKIQNVRPLRLLPARDIP